MNRVDRASAAVLLLFGLVACFESARLGLIKEGRPDSGFWPLICAAIVVLLAGIQLLSRGQPSRKPPKWPQGKGSRQIGTYAVALLAFLPLTQNLGFLIGSFLFLGLLLRYPGGYKWKTVAAFSIAVSVILFVGLDRLLGVTLPKGVMAMMGF